MLVTQTLSKKTVSENNNIIASNTQTARRIIQNNFIATIKQ